MKLSVKVWEPSLISIHLKLNTELQNIINLPVFNLILKEKYRALV